MHISVILLIFTGLFSGLIYFDGSWDILFQYQAGIRHSDLPSNNWLRMIFHILDWSSPQLSYEFDTSSSVLPTTIVVSILFDFDWNPIRGMQNIY